jgi:hypothetical protein
MTKEVPSARRWKPNSTIVAIIAVFLFWAALEALGIMPDRDTRRNILGGLAVIAIAGVGVTWLGSLLAKRKQAAAGDQADGPEAP